MTRRSLWLGVFVLASQVVAGCCHHRCLGWRLRSCGVAAPSYSAPVSVLGPTCPSCYGPAADVPVVAAPAVGYPILTPQVMGAPTVIPSREVPSPMPTTPMK